jgi:hypothetical protein
VAGQGIDIVETSEVTLQNDGLMLSRTRIRTSLALKVYEDENCAGTI